MFLFMFQRSEFKLSSRGFELLFNLWYFFSRLQSGSVRLKFFLFYGVISNFNSFKCGIVAGITWVCSRGKVVGET